MIFARKNAQFFIIIARKIFSPNFRGHVPPLPPVSYAYGIQDGGDLARGFAVSGCLPVVIITSQCTRRVMCSVGVHGDLYS